MLQSRPLIESSACLMFHHPAEPWFNSSVGHRIELKVVQNKELQEFMWLQFCQENALSQRVSLGQVVKAGTCFHSCGWAPARKFTHVCVSLRVKDICVGQEMKRHPIGGCRNVNMVIRITLQWVNLPSVIGNAPRVLWMWNGQKMTSILESLCWDWWRNFRPSVWNFRSVDRFQTKHATACRWPLTFKSA